MYGSYLPTKETRFAAQLVRLKLNPNKDKLITCINQKMKELLDNIKNERANNNSHIFSISNNLNKWCNKILILKYTLHALENDSAIDTQILKARFKKSYQGQTGSLINIAVNILPSYQENKENKENNSDSRFKAIFSSAGKMPTNAVATPRDHINDNDNLEDDYKFDYLDYK